MHAYRLTHTQKHKHRHTHTHTQKHTHTHTNTHTQAHTHSRALSIYCTHTHTHTHTHTSTHTHTHLHTSCRYIQNNHTILFLSWLCIHIVEAHIFMYFYIHIVSGMVFVFTLRQAPRRHGTRYPYGPCYFIALAALCILAGMYIINMHASTLHFCQYVYH